jgi:hypothetical protein
MDRVSPFSQTCSYSIVHRPCRSLNGIVSRMAGLTVSVLVQKRSCEFWIEPVKLLSPEPAISPATISLLTTSPGFLHLKLTAESQDTTST